MSNFNETKMVVYHISYKDIKIGDKFNMLEVISLPFKKDGRRSYYCKFRCECGIEKVIEVCALKKTRSCGCWKKEYRRRNPAQPIIKHGGFGTNLYGVWHSIKSRCFNPNATGYKDYGGRGIVVCDDWRYDFINFKTWAEKSGYQEYLTIERIDVNLGYYPINCKWIPPEDQSKNRRRNNEYLGVSFDKRKNKWVAYITDKPKGKGKQKHIGYFNTKIEAVDAFNKTSIEMYGDKATLNKVLLR